MGMPNIFESRLDFCHVLHQRLILTFFVIGVYVIGTVIFLLFAFLLREKQ